MEAKQTKATDGTTPVSIVASFAPEAAPAPIKVWLVDDDDSYRSLLAGLLVGQPGIACPRQFNSPDAVLSTLASKSGPDVLLLDVHMRERNGLDAIRPIKSLARSTRVLMLTTFYDSHCHSRALEEGASGFLLKSAEVRQLAEHIRKLDPPGPGGPRRCRKRRPVPAAAPASSSPSTSSSRSRWWGRLPWISGLLR